MAIWNNRIQNGCRIGEKVHLLKRFFFCLAAVKYSLLPDDVVLYLKYDVVCVWNVLVFGLKTPSLSSFQSSVPPLPIPLQLAHPICFLFTSLNPPSSHDSSLRLPFPKNATRCQVNSWLLFHFTYNFIGFLGLQCWPIPERSMTGLVEAPGTKSSVETITYDPWQRSCSSSWRLVR